MYIFFLYVVSSAAWCLAQNEVIGQKELGKNVNITVHGTEMLPSQRIKSITSPNQGTVVGNSLGRYGREGVNSPLHVAVSNRDLQEITELLDNGEDVNVRGNDGVTPLMLAALAGYEDVVDTLISRNASLELKDEFDNVAIHHAVKNGNLHVLKMLLDHEVDVNVKGNMGMTPLMLASWNGDEDAVNLLISRNASLELKNNVSDAAIHIALLRKKIRLYQVLINHGANVNSKGENDNTPLILAVMSEAKTIVSQNTNPLSKMSHVTCLKCCNKNLLHLVPSLVERGADVNAQNLIGLTALHVAAARGRVDIVDYLLSQNASFKLQDNIYYTPFHWAANDSKIAVIKKLLEYGDDVNRKGYSNVTALHLAIERNDSNLMEFLLSRNADPNVMREDGRTPLDVAFQRSNKPFIKLLLQHGAKVEDNSFLGSKVLFGAVANKSLELMNLFLDKAVNFNSYSTIILNYAIGTKFLEGTKLLISHGANIELKDLHGNVPLSSAVISKCSDFVKLILETGVRKIAKENIKNFLDVSSTINVFSIIKNRTEKQRLTALHIAAYHGLTDIGGLLISYGASLGARDGRNYTPLHYACENGNLEIVKLLLDSGANKSSTDVHGTAPVHLACRRGHFDIVKLLLSVTPVDIDIADNDGFTPLHFAVINGSLEIVELLVEFNADVDARSKNMTTPLHFASIEGHEEIVRVLLGKGADSEASDVDDMTPMHFAAREINPNIVQLLIDAKGFSASKNKNGSSPLHLVCGSYNVRRKQLPLSNDLIKDTIKNVRQKLIFQNDKDNNKMSVLHIAARDGSTTCMEQLIKSHDFFGDVWQNSPLHYAALNGHIEIIRMILEKDDKEPKEVNINHETPLILASREGHTDVVALLLQSGVDEFRPDINGRTPLHRSAASGHFEIVKLLLSRMAKREAEDKWGFTPLNYAASWKGHQDVIGYLSTPQLNITLSYYFNISNPFEQYSAEVTTFFV